MKQAAAGFRVHSGWAAMVAVCAEKGAPRVVARERVHLVETFTYRFRQPYHTAKKMQLDEAREFVAGVEKESQKLAYRAIQVLRAELQEQGIELTLCGLLMASGKALPSFENILASHALIHTADGELFRESLLCAAKRSGIATAGIKERQLFERAKQTLRTRPAVLLRRVTELAKPLGPPWSQDEKFATLAAWLALTTSGNSDGAAPRRHPKREKA